MELLKKQSERPGMEKYTDLYLKCDVDGVEKFIRVRPVFWRDMGLLKKIAEDRE